ncbi:MAG: hypothetical protein K0R22_2625, partial [Sporomusa sp.]|nr:hypothetical protein [Sporomusa sp.]
AYLRVTAKSYAGFIGELAAINDWQSKQASSFTNKWLEFTKYRNIPVVAVLGASGTDYQI